jgi:hypothetical protein
LTDRGAEYCRAKDHHEYQLILTIEAIDHTKTKAYSPQTNDICERFLKTIQEEFYSIAFRKKMHTTNESLQEYLDEWINYYNTQRTHSGKYCYGKTPLKNFGDSRHLADENIIDNYFNYGNVIHPKKEENLC